jgi:hypothetical protein
MRTCPIHVALVMTFAVGSWMAAAVPQSGHAAHGQPGPAATDGLRDALPPPQPVEASPAAGGAFPLLVRPSTLAAQIEELAGQSVRVLYARVVGVFNPRVFLIDTSTRLPPVRGHRARVVVLVERGALSVPAASLVASTVTVAGVARTLLGVQVNREVAWPTELSPEKVDRLEVRAAVLASSVRTAEGIELTSPSVR